MHFALERQSLERRISGAFVQKMRRRGGAMRNLRFQNGTSSLQRVDPASARQRGEGAAPAAGLRA